MPYRNNGRQRRHLRFIYTASGTIWKRLLQIAVHAQRSPSDIGARNVIKEYIFPSAPGPVSAGALT